jgi:hypothetical protein
MNLAGANFDDFLTQNNTFASLAGYEYGLTSVSDGSELCASTSPRCLMASSKHSVSSLFRGRAFLPDEQRLRGAPAVIVSYSYWQRYLGGKTDLSKFHLAMEGAVYPVCRSHAGGI